MQIVTVSLHDLQVMLDRTAERVIQSISSSKLPPPDEPDYLSRSEACKRLGGISLVTLGEYTKTGILKGYRIGRRVLYSQADISAALTAIKTNGDAGRNVA